MVRKGAIKLVKVSVCE